MRAAQARDPWQKAQRMGIMIGAVFGPLAIQRYRRTVS
jgi:hypothetical protein